MKILLFLSNCVLFVVFTGCTQLQIVKVHRSDVGHTILSNIVAHSMKPAIQMKVPLYENRHKILGIGAILDGEEAISALRMAVEYVNERNILGPSYSLTYLLNKTQIIATTESIQLACWQAEQGVMAFIGARSSTATKALSPVSTGLHIPQITPTATNPQLGLTANFPYLMRMMAADTIQSRALVDLVETMGWTRMAILTSNTDYGVNGLVEFQSEAAKRDWKIMSVQHFEVTSDPSEVDVRDNLELIKSTGVRVILLNCLTEFGIEVMNQAKEVGMTGGGWAWVVTDGMTGSGNSFDSGVPEHLQGLIGTKPSAGHGTLWSDVVKRWASLDPTEYPGAGPGTALSAYSFYIVDAVMTFAYAVGNMYRYSNNSVVQAEKLTCDAKGEPWKYGDVMLHYLKMAQGPGSSSYLEFNDDASPKHPRFDVVNLHSDGWKEVGFWTPQRRLLLSVPDEIRFMGAQEIVEDYVSALSGKHINIVTILEKPFVMMKTDIFDKSNLSTTTDVEGFCIDILERLAESINFTYTLYLVPDNNFGAKDPVTYQWNGMVKELVFRKADMAVASLTISYPREQDIDYTVPYLDLGMSFVMKVPKTEKPPPFRFLEPFNQEVWMFVILTTFVVALYISVLNKLSPYDYHGKFMYIDNETQEEEAMRSYGAYRYYKRELWEKTKALGLSNSIMFSTGALLQQGYERYPKSLSGRLTSVTWWLGTVIIVSTYTANLASLLTASRSQKNINSVEDLGGQTRVKYGTVANSAPYQFFADSNLTLFQDMKDYMVTQNTLVAHSGEGLDKVRNEDYAFVWDSAVLDYSVEEKPCNSIQTVGRLFGKIGYGFGLQKSSPYREELSTQILKLREAGYMDQLKVKWYQQRGQCASESQKDKSEAKALEALGGQLGFDHMIGVFYIIYGGCALSVFILIAEWLFAAYDAIDTNDTSKPQSYSQALRKQFANLRDDFVDDWLPQFPSFFPCCKPRVTKEQKQLENIKESLQINTLQELAAVSKVAGVFKKVLDDKTPTTVNTLPSVDLPIKSDIFLKKAIYKNPMVSNGSPLSNGSRMNGEQRPSLSAPLGIHMNGSPRSSISSANYLNPSEPSSPIRNVPDILY